MRTFVLPDEDTWVLPTAWRDGLHPRRGGHPAPVRPVPADPAGQLRDRLASEDIRKVRDRKAEREVIVDPALLAAGEHYLDRRRDPADPGDDPDVRGAAVAALLTCRRYRHCADELMDLWTARSGLEFAVRVVGEASRIVAGRTLWRVDPAAKKSYERLWRTEDTESLYTLAQALRSRLAAASDADYARACEILGEYRTSPTGRIITSYAAPTRVAWVDEDCNTAAYWQTDEDEPRRLSAILLLAASTPRHLAALRGTISDALLGWKTPGEIGTLLDGVGPAAVPFLVEPFYLKLLWQYESDRHDRLGPDLIRLLAALPSDDAFRLLCRSTLDGPRTRPAAFLKSGAMARYPVRAMRILAERETGEPSTSTDLLGALVLTDPRLLPAAAPSLPPAVRARAEEIESTGGAGIGAGWAGLLDDHHGRRWMGLLDGAEDEKRAITALAALPTGEAFGHLVDRVERQYVRPALLTAAKRHPAVALRVLVAKTSGDGTAAELLRNHVLTYPETAAEVLPSLDEAGQALVLAHLPQPSSASAEPAGEVPAVLAGPPRRPDGKPMRVPGLPEWLVIPALPAVRPRTGGVLPQDAARRLCELLAVSTIGQAHPALDEVQAVCEPRSLATFAWAILEQWRAAAYPAKNNLAMVALARLGGDGVVPALTELFPVWANGSAMRVRTGMDVLAAIGTDLALTHLQRFARKAKTAGFRRLAQERLAAVAEARGLRPDQLADRIVPDLGLDADGQVTLDFGPRRFTVALDDQLQPRLTDQRGTRLTRLPRASATDDPALAADAARRFAELKKEAKTVTAERLRAIEEAMVLERRWTADEFQRLLVEHRLMWQLTRRLLWVAYDEHGTAGPVFRAAEDRTFADVDDKAITLGPAATVGVAHPWHFDADRAGWAALLDDYALLQPFPQVGRELIGRAEAALDSAAGTPVEGRRLYSLTARGWRFADGHSMLTRDFTGDRSVEIEFSPGYHWQEPDAPQQVGAVRVSITSAVAGNPVCGGCAQRHPRPEDAAQAGDLSPIALSETARDLRFLRG